MTVRRRLVALVRSLRPATTGAVPRPRHDEGSTIIEFAIVAPVFITLLMVTFDIGQMAFANAMLRGAVQDAARGSALETGDTTAADEKVRTAITSVLPGSTVITSRVNYFDFDDIGRAEIWEDGNSNGECDNGESYTDENRSGSFEKDVGRSGNGGAGDVVIYEVDVSYTSLFKIPDFWSQQSVRDTWGTRHLSAKAVRKNQPFAKQLELGSESRKCPA